MENLTVLLLFRQKSRSIGTFYRDIFPRRRHVHLENTFRSDITS